MNNQVYEQFNREDLISIIKYLQKENEQIKIITEALEEYDDLIDFTCNMFESNRKRKVAKELDELRKDIAKDCKSKIKKLGLRK